MPAINCLQKQNWGKQCDPIAQYKFSKNHDDSLHTSFGLGPGVAISSYCIQQYHRRQISL
jgi:hypothetical protein